MVRFFSRKSKNADSRRVLKTENRRLAIEALESREMLAADMAEVTGIVRVDLQGDNDASNDVVVAGATATLYRDNGNGQLDAGDSTVGASVQTDAAGKYTFSQVAAGNYFVKVTLPSDLQFRAGEDVKAVTVSADEGDGIVGPTIDGFTTFQTVEAVPPPVTSDANTLFDPAVLGQERDVYVELTESTNPISSVSLATSGGNLYVASGPGATGSVKIVWDGTDGDARNVNATGLGGIDLTESNGNTMTGIALTSGADHPNAKIMMRIYTDANNWTEFTTLVPESPGGAAAGQAIFNFDDIPTGQSGLGADFTNVGALELTFEGVTAVDAQVSLIGLVGRATKRADFTASPRLSLGDKVWYDVDDDGLREAGELPIAGVKLNLYEDVNLDNQYTPGIDQALGSQTTDANGMYLFTDLFPGKYVVQVDATNFGPTGPLAGLRSSLEGTTASDPDNDVNDDDNGTSQAGAGVVSQAIMLMGQGEPTNDGDADYNTNRTVDFGFFRFRFGARQRSATRHRRARRHAELHDHDRQRWAFRSCQHNFPRYAASVRDFRVGIHKSAGRQCSARKRNHHGRPGHDAAGRSSGRDHRRDSQQQRDRYAGQHRDGQCAQRNQPLEQHRHGFESAVTTHRFGHRQDR